MASNEKSGKRLVKNSTPIKGYCNASDSKMMKLCDCRSDCQTVQIREVSKFSNKNPAKKTKFQHYPGVVTCSKSKDLINTINNDCLAHIFSYLTKPELIKIERVCTRWRNLCLEIWSRQREFNLKLATWGIFEINYLLKIFRKCGYNLKHLDLHEIAIDLSNERQQVRQIIAIIGYFCSRLETLNLSAIPLRITSLKPIISKTAGNLTVLKLDDCSIEDTSLSPLFQKAVNLREISLVKSKIRGACLFYVTDNLKCLNLNKCRDLEPSLFAKAVKRLPRLEVLKANKTQINLETIKLLPKSLIELSIRHVSQCLQENEGISFPVLRVLDVSRNRWLTDTIFSVICDVCPNVAALNLEDCDKLCQFTPLEKLLNLEVLRLDRCGVGDDVIIYLAFRSNGRFKKIGCRDCDLTDYGASRMVTLSPQLSCIDVGENYQLTDGFLSSAFDAVMARTNNVVLTIHGYCGRPYSSEEYSHPLLKVEDEDCHCLHDFDCDCATSESSGEEEYSEEEESEYENFFPMFWGYVYDDYDSSDDYDYEDSFDEDTAEDEEETEDEDA